MSTYNPKDQMFAKVVLASVSENSPPIFTVHMRYPRIIHGEIMTHRVFSRNARSSRAVPVKTMLEEIRNTPFIPWHWGKNQGGMQADEECNALITIPEICGHTADLEANREAMWLWLRDANADVAEAMMTAGYHKQVVNRVVETYSWIDTLVTSTDWANFFHLRDHPDAEPHFRDLAQLVKEAISSALPNQLKEGEWHLPYVDQADIKWANTECAKSPEFCGSEIDLLAPISAARCARISYKPFDGDASYEREMARYGDLIGNSAVHASPLEHQAQVDETWNDGLDTGWMNPELSGNFRAGWIQARKLVPNEAVHD